MNSARHSRAQEILFTTPRLCIRRAGTDDADLFYRLWTSPAVMGNVGFPRGLPTWLLLRTRFTIMSTTRTVKRGARRKNHPQIASIPEKTSRSPHICR